METIRNYLESMFQKLPNTPEVQRAKFELGQMMEDKYTELKNEGKSENEAIGIVISEFGNLDELAFDLGISGYMNPNNNMAGKQVTLAEVKDYLKDKIRSGYMIGLGVLLCICSPCGVILADYIGWFDFVGIVFLFAFIALAVGLFVFAGAMMGKWSYMHSQPCSIDFSTAEYVHGQRENYRMTNAMMNTVGVIFCFCCFIPLVIMDELGMGNLFEGIGVAILFLFVGIGVYFLIAASYRNSAYETILKLNERGTMGASFVASQKEVYRYTNKIVAAVMSVYWPTVTCIYISWSFLSADWHITWIIWVIASLVENFIKNAFRE